MLSSISPLGERTRGSRWWVTTVSYVVGSLLGAVVLGAAAGGLGSLLPQSWLDSRAAASTVALLLVACLILDVSGRLPSWRRQVDETWITTYRGWAVGLGFGTQLGFGLVTIVTSATTYAMVTMACWSGNVVTGVLIGAVFGLVRALPAVAMGVVHERDQLYQVFRAVERFAAPMDLVAKLSLALGAVVAIVTAAA